MLPNNPGNSMLPLIVMDGGSKVTVSRKSLQPFWVQKLVDKWTARWTYG
jgi:hypothetical protein